MMFWNLRLNLLLFNNLRMAINCELFWFVEQCKCTVRRICSILSWHWLWVLAPISPDLVPIDAAVSVVCDPGVCCGVASTQHCICCVTGAELCCPVLCHPGLTGCSDHCSTQFTLLQSFQLSTSSSLWDSDRSCLWLIKGVTVGPEHQLLLTALLEISSKWRLSFQGLSGGRKNICVSWVKPVLVWSEWDGGTLLGLSSERECSHFHTSGPCSPGCF